MACKIRAAELLTASEAIDRAREELGAAISLTEAANCVRCTLELYELKRWCEAGDLAYRLLEKIVESCNVRVGVEGPSTEPQQFTSYPAVGADEDPPEELEETADDLNPYEPGHPSNGTRVI